MSFRSLTRMLPLGGILASIPAVANISSWYISMDKTGSGFPGRSPPPCHKISGVVTRTSLFAIEFDFCFPAIQNSNSFHTSQPRYYVCPGVVAVLPSTFKPIYFLLTYSLSIASQICCCLEAKKRTVNERCTFPGTF
jgi:hypothetical protein